ncbi:MAG: CBS domain-containing protein [Candidatus Geothermarchaeales archaeon]
MKRLVQRVRRTLLPHVRAAVRRPHVTVDSKEKLEAVVAKMRSIDAVNAVVLDGERVLGVVSADKVLDHLLREKEAWGETPVDAVLLEGAAILEADANLAEAAESLRDEDVSWVVVLRGSEVTGVLRRADVRLASPKGYRSPSLFAKRFLGDTFAYVSFWTLPLALVQLYLVRISVPQFLVASVIGFLVTLLLAGAFGGYLDFVRAKLGVGP